MTMAICVNARTAFSLLFPPILKHYGPIFGTLMLSALAGGAVGPWFMGFVHDRTGNYTLAFWVAIGCSVLSAFAIWRAAPSGVRVVAGRVRAAQESDEGAA